MPEDFITPEQILNNKTGHQSEFQKIKPQAELAYAEVNALIAAAEGESLEALVQDQINQVAMRRNKGVRKTDTEVMVSLLGNDPKGDITGRKKKGEGMELAEVLKLYGKIPTLSELPQDKIAGLHVDLEQLMSEMADEADTDSPLSYNENDTPESQLTVAIKATAKIADEAADLVYYANYVSDKSQTAKLMEAAQQITGWDADTLRKLAIVKYYVRNNHADLLKTGDKKQDKKSRKAIEQAVMARYIWEHAAVAMQFKPDAHAEDVIHTLVDDYRLGEKEKLRNIPHSNIIIADLGGTIVDVEPLFEATHKKIAAKRSVVWDSSMQEELEAKLREARLTDPNVSRMEVFYKILEKKDADTQSARALRAERDQELEAEIAKSTVDVQPGVVKLIDYIKKSNGRVIVYTGFDDRFVQMLKTRIPQLSDIEIFLRVRGETDTEAIKRILEQEGIDPKDCTGLFHAPTHVLGGLLAGLASGKFPMIYVPTMENLEAQAQSFGFKDDPNKRKVYESPAIEDLVDGWSGQS